jgi:hypothetical protein
MLGRLKDCLQNKTLTKNFSKNINFKIEDVAAGNYKKNI